MSKSQVVDDLLALADVDFLSYLILRRMPHAHETWPKGGLKCGRVALRAIFQTLNDHSAAAVIKQEQDQTRLSSNEDFVKRAFFVLLDRFPSSDEVLAWTCEEQLNVDLLVYSLYFSEEAYKADGQLCTFETLTSDVNRLQFLSSFSQFDAYTKSTRARIANYSAEARRRKLSFSDKLRVGFTIFGTSAEDEKETIRLLAIYLPSLQFEIKIIKQDEVTLDVLNQFDVFIANQNFLYADLFSKLAAMKQSSCVSACWHWDDHHMFELNGYLSDGPDYVFPAHTNGSLALFNGSAVVGQVVPCCVMQWPIDEAMRLFAESAGRKRSNRLYGSFNSYPGRAGLRDGFLLRAQSQIPENDIRVIKHSDNRWWHRSIDERYFELADNKIVLCNPIYHDVPARLFDSLLVGAIPLVPYGLSDVELSFPFDQKKDLPIINFIPDDMTSLARACQIGIESFDRDGLAGIRKRHHVAINHHMLSHRMARLVYEVVTCESAKSL